MWPGSDPPDVPPQGKYEMTTAVRTGLTDLVADAQRYLRRILPGLASAVHPLASLHAIPHAMASRYHLAGLMLMVPPITPLLPLRVGVVSLVTSPFCR